MKNIFKRTYSKRNKTRFFLFVCLFVLQAIAFLHAQSLPNPLYDFPLESDNPARYYIYYRGSIVTVNGEKGGTFTPHKDRYGNPKGAVSFKNPDSYISESHADVVLRKQNRPVTISFWTYMATTSPVPSGSIPYNPDMMKRRFYTLNTDNKSGGLSKVKSNALLGFERTVTVNSTNKPWYLWLYEPTIMDQKGWYHVVVVHGKNYTKTYMFKPDESKTCSYNYMGNNFDKKLIIGNKQKHLGEFVESANVMDDYKGFLGVLTESQIDFLHREETVHVTEGNYLVKMANTKYMLHTKSNSTSDSAVAEIYPYNENYFNTYQWYFDFNEDGTFKIKMRGTNEYLHTKKNEITASTGVEIYPYKSLYSQSYNWVIEPAKQLGKYYIRLAANKNMYLHTVSNSRTISAGVEIYTYDLSNDDSYLWKFDAIPETPKISGTGKRISLDGNPYLFLRTDANFDVGYYNNNVYPKAWYFERNIDGSYIIYYNNTRRKLYLAHGVNSGDGTYSIHTSNLKDSNIQWFVVPKGNNRFVLRSTSNASFFLHSKSNTLADKGAEISSYNDTYKSSYEVVIRDLIDFDYPIKNGTYNIRLEANNNQYLHSKGDSISSSVKTEIYPYHSSNFNTYEWIVKKSDFGTYTLRMLGAEPKQYLHTVGNKLTNSTSVEIYPMNVLKIESYRWIFDKYSNGNYSLKLAGNAEQYLHTKKNSVNSSTAVELYPYKGSNINTYRWKFTEVSNNPVPKLSGDYYIQLSGTNQLLHTVSNSKSSSATVEIYPYNSSEDQSYKWSIIPGKDRTFRIKLKDTENYLHTKKSSSDYRAKVEIYKFKDNIFDTYSWFIFPTKSAVDEYYIRFVPNASAYLHTVSNSTSSSAAVEIYNFLSNYGRTYRWKIKSSLGASSRLMSSKPSLNNEKKLLSNIDSDSNVYPNPSDGTITLNLNLSQTDIVTFILYDFNGKNIYQKSLKLKKGNQSVWLDGLKAKGVNSQSIYILKAVSSSNEELISKKIMFK